MDDVSCVALSLIRVSVSVVNNFIHPQTASDYGYHAFGELARFIYCLLQKIKQGISSPLVEQLEKYVLAKHSKFPPIADGELLSRTRVLAALNKIRNSCLKKEFQRDARRFLEEFTTSVLSAVAARSKVGQGLSCFCPAIIIGGYNHASASAGSVVGWNFGTWVDKGQWDRGLLGWKVVLCPRAKTAGAVFDEERPWHMWFLDVLLFASWFSCSSASV